MRHHNFQNLLQVLCRQEPSRPTLFEFFMNDHIYDYYLAGDSVDDRDGLGAWRRRLVAFARAGYDYVTLHASDYKFPCLEIQHARTISQNQSGIITDRESYQRYVWPDPEAFAFDRLEILGSELPEGMKLIAYGPGGVLENVTSLVGFTDMCLLLTEDPDLLKEIFDAVGSRLLRYYQRCLEYPAVGAVIINDDWGFIQQTMLSPADMRRLVFPWQRLMVAAIHQSGRPAILHSCGNLREVWDDIIDDMRFDGKHSYEDKIQPVEEAYEEYGRRIAILGGFDLDFICRSTPDEIRRRVRSMLERTAGRGGFAIGTGNSVPDYVPLENYLAMIEAVQT